MPRGTDKANEFKRYRQWLAAFYLAFIGLGVVLLSASVVRELFFRPVVQLQGPILSAKNPASGDLLRCHDDVASLYDDLASTTARLFALPFGQDSQILREWEEFSRGWLVTWERVDAWCRFSELAKTNVKMGDAYARMARVHRDLPAMRLKYQSLLVRFDDRQAAELVRMRRDLESSRMQLSGTQGANDGEAP